jgi:hypothetical protein
MKDKQMNGGFTSKLSIWVRNPIETLPKGCTFDEEYQFERPSSDEIGSEAGRDADPRD